MENQEIQQIKVEESTNSLRKYTSSPVTALAFIAFIVFITTKSNITFNPLISLAVFTISAFSGFYPLRIKSNTAFNEFYIDGFAIVFGILILDPFQLATSFALGNAASHIVNKFSVKRIYINGYCNFSVLGLVAIIFSSPINSNSPFVLVFAALAYSLHAILDTISFYAVCKFEAKEIIGFMYSSEKIISLLLGIGLGLPAGFLYMTHKPYAFIIVAIYVAICLLINKYNEILSRNEQLKETLKFISEIDQEEEIQQSLERIVNITKSAFRHDGISIRGTGPTKNEIGDILYTDQSKEYWLIVNKADFSKTRVAADEKLVQEIVLAARKVFEHKELQDQLHRAARQDPLTGLYNRSTLEDYINHELGLVKRNKSQFSLMFIDLDKFKPINDEYGHRAGDEVLNCIARRLTLTVRAQDVVARIGGDEFVILCRDISPEEAADLAARISDEVCKPVFLDTHLESEERVELTVGASIGLSNAPEDGISFEKLLKVADTRMYKAKKSRVRRVITSDKIERTKSA